MKLTNIRFNNNFIIFDKDKFYLSKVTKDIFYKYSKNKRTTDLNEYKDDEITETLKELMNKYNIYSNVNFCGFSTQSGGG